MEVMTADNFPAPRAFQMNASSLRTVLRGIFLATMLILPATCPAQSDQAPAPRNDYIVSVKELRMAGKGHKAFDKGSHMLAKGDAAGSLVYLRQAIAEYPQHYEAYYDLGVAHFRLGHTVEAEQAFQKSIDLTAGAFAPPHFGMGALLCKNKEFSQAERVLQKGLELEPASAIGKYYLGWAQFALNRLEEAERNVQQALVRNTHFAEARALLERIHHRQAAIQSAADNSVASARP
jgi:tetratricopeptide (TPR) repeat protein